MAKNMAPITLLYSEIVDAIEDSETPNLGAVEEIVVRVAGYYPALTFQAIVRFRDRSMPWACVVDSDPYLAQQKAMALALRGKKAILAESTALYHQTKEAASNVMNRLTTDNRNLIAGGHVEFEPMKGWVPVLFHKKGVDMSDLLQFAGQAEVREIEDEKAPPQPNKNRRKTTARSGEPGESKDAPTKKDLPPRKGRRARTDEAAPVETPKPKRAAAPTTPANLDDMRTWKKSALIKYHQEQFGKQPNNKLSVEEIVNLIETKLAEKG